MKRFWILLFAVVLVSSCMTIDLRSTFAQPASLTNAAGKEYTIVGHFTREVRVYFTVNGAVRLTDTNKELDKTLNDEVGRYHGDGVVNLKMKDELNGLDILISLGMTAGGYLVGTAINYSSSPYSDSGVMVASAVLLLFPMLLQSRTVNLEGDVFKYN